MRRFEPAPGGVWPIAVLGLLAAVKAAALMGMAEAVARGVVSVIAGDDRWKDAVALGVAAGLLRALVAWAAQSFATRAAIGGKERVRHDLVARLLSGGDVRVGAATATGAVGLDELDAYYRTALPAGVTAAVVPLLIGSRILLADWVSAVIIIVTVPLIPVFMALVGMHTRDRAEEASATLQRLSNHLVELARGLPVLVGLGRVSEQASALRSVSESHRTTTMTTLRSAFLSSLVLELIATLSVAVMAVFVGLRLVTGDLPLAVGLIALVLAPECFAPFRELGSAFHSSQDGLAALRRSREIVATPLPREARRTGGVLRISGLVVRYEGRDSATIDGLDLTIERGSVTCVEGASGSGKSTLLGVLAGVVTAREGEVAGVDAERIGWVPQHPATVGETVREEIALYAAGGADTERAIRAMDLTRVAHSDPARLSPGELRRVAVARGLVRVDSGATLLLLDEPTAHLDPAHARRVEEAIEALRGRVTIVMASHEAGMTRLADHRIRMGAPSGSRDVAEAEELVCVEETTSGDLPLGSAWGELLEFLRPMGWRLAAALALAVGAALFSVALTALSGWLIVRASEHPPIMYLTVAIVGVRFFGIGRAVLRYSERLLTHSAVLASVTDLRLRLWFGLAECAPSSRELATGAVALDYLVAAADRVRDLVPRVILPPVVAVVTGAAAVAAAAMLHPAAAPILAGGLAVSLVGAPALAVWADHTASTATSTARSAMLRQFASTVAAADDLRANGIAARMLDRLDTLDATTGMQARASSLALGLGNGLVVLASSATSVLMLPATAVSVAASSMSGATAAVLVLIPLALIDPLLGTVDAVQQWPALRTALAKVGGVGAVRPASAVAPAATEPTDSIDLSELQVGWRESQPSSPVTATARRGEWIVVEGQSGVGKSTLLATLMGFIPAAAGSWSVNGTPVVAPLRSRIAWCPQEGHLFDSTIRGNLLLARARNDLPTEEELSTVLEVAGLTTLVASLPRGLDSPIGSGGSRLSGGERQRLAVARALLTRADLALLDEPTAHLDEENAARLLEGLRAALADRIVILVSHHSSEHRPGDHRIVLEPARLTLTSWCERSEWDGSIVAARQDDARTSPL